MLLCPHLCDDFSLFIYYTTVALSVCSNLNTVFDGFFRYVVWGGGLGSLASLRLNTVEK